MASKMDALMKDLNKSVKEDVLSRGLAQYHYQKIPFTSPRMNYCTYGGLPVGKLIEFYGEEHGGKTTTALDSMYVLQPKAQSAEQIFQLIEDSVETGEIGLFVIDSLGAMVSSGELDPKKTYEDKFYGGISMPLTRFSKKIEMLMARHNCTGIGINQVREDMNSQWGGYTTPGGKAWKHLCAVRIQFSRGKFFDEKGNDLSRAAETPRGNFVQMSITKIKSAPPNRRTGFYTLNYEIGIDYLADLVEVALKCGVIQQSGAWFTIAGVPDKIQGQAGVYEYLKSHQDVLDAVDELVNKQIS